MQNGDKKQKPFPAIDAQRLSVVSHTKGWHLGGKVYMIPDSSRRGYLICSLNENVPSPSYETPSPFLPTGRAVVLKTETTVLVRV